MKGESPCAVPRMRSVAALFVRRAPLELGDERGVFDVEHHGQHGHVACSDRPQLAVEVLSLHLDALEEP